MIFSMIFHYAVLIYAIYRQYRYKSMYKYRNHPLNIYYETLIKKYFRFVFAYTILWILPTFARLWFVFEKNVPFWLLCAHHLGFGLTGVIDAIVWAINKYIPKKDNELNDQKYRNSSNSTHENYQRYSDFGTSTITTQATVTSLPNS